MRRHLIGMLVSVHALAERAALRFADEHVTACPTCQADPCYVHCYECGADCDTGSHEEWCETGAGMDYVTVRDLLRGGILCGQCDEPLRWGDAYGSRPFSRDDAPIDLPEFADGCETRLSVCLACAAS